MKITDFKKNKRSQDFFLQDAVAVAKNVLGDYLVVRDKDIWLVGKVVEVESYLGIDDDASHNFGGKITQRNKVMYSDGGVIYIYFIYGKYWCFNIVVSKKGSPQAVFIRALEPVLGKERMMENKKTNDIRKLTSGPCRWTSAFGIDERFLAKSITSRQIYISYNPLKNYEIVKAKRIGIDYAHVSKDLFLRFYIKDNPFVSKK